MNAVIISEETTIPADPRIIFTSTREQFIDAARNGPSLLMRPFGDKQEEFLGIFRKIWDAAEKTGTEEHPNDPEWARKRRNEILKQHFRTEAGSNGEIQFAVFPEIYEPGREYLTKMAQIFSEITGKAAMIGKIFPNIRTTPNHTHLYPVMNWPLINYGATWTDEQRRTWTVSQGDGLFMPAGFEHGSSPGERLTVNISRDPQAHLR